MDEFLAGRKLIRDILDRAARITDESSRISDKLGSISIKQSHLAKDDIPARSAPRLETLPPDVMAAVTGHLGSARHICKLMQVCKSLHHCLSKDEQPWQHLCLRDFGQRLEGEEAPNQAPDTEPCAPLQQQNPVMYFYISMCQAWQNVQHSLQWLQEHNRPAGVSGRAHRQQLLTALEHMVFFTTSDDLRSSMNRNLSQGTAGSFDTAQYPESCSTAASSPTVNADKTAGQAKLVEQMLQLGAVPSLVALVRWQDQLHVHELVCQVLANLVQSSAAACKEILVSTQTESTLTSCTLLWCGASLHVLPTHNQLYQAMSALSRLPRGRQQLPADASDQQQAGGYANALKPLLYSHSAAVVYQACRALTGIWRFQHSRQQAARQRLEIKGCRPHANSQDGSQSDRQEPCTQHNAMPGHLASRECKVGDLRTASGAQQPLLLMECCSTGDVARCLQIQPSTSEPFADLAAVLTAGLPWRAQCTQVQQLQAAAQGALEPGLAWGDERYDECYTFHAVKTPHGTNGLWQCWLWQSPVPKEVENAGIRSSGHALTAHTSTSCQRPKLASNGPNCGGTEATQLQKLGHIYAVVPAEARDVHVGGAYPDYLASNHANVNNAIYTYQGWWDKAARCMCGIYGTTEAFEKAIIAGCDVSGGKYCSGRSTAAPGLRVFWIEVPYSY